MDPYFFIGSDFGICVGKNQSTFENQGFIMQVKNICIDQRLGKYYRIWEEFKQSETLISGKCNTFHTVNS